MSNDVLTAEIEAVEKHIAQFSAKGRPVPEDIKDRKEALDFHQQMLVSQVSAGQLTMDVYLERVKTAVARDKKLAVALNRAGRKPEARQVLHRSKVMEQEMVNVAEAIEAGEIEE